MNRRNMMKGMSALMVMTSFAMIASVVAAQEGDTATAAAHWDAQKLGAEQVWLLDCVELELE